VTLGIVSLGMRAEALKGHLDGLVLATLQRGPLHGYAVIEELRGRSDGAFDLAEGTVYPVLHRLEAEGLLASAWSSPAGRRRRVYRLTRKGRGTLDRRRNEWRSFAGAVEAVLA
jgi:PadR family transcriptional regulator PadR